MKWSSEVSCQSENIFQASFCIFFDCSSFERITSLPNQILLHEQRTTEISMLKIHSPDGSGAQLISVMHMPFRLESYQNLNFSRIYSQKYLKQCSSPTTIISILVKIWLMNQKKRKIYHKFTRISCFNVVNVFINIQPFKISRRKNIN